MNHKFANGALITTFAGLLMAGCGGSGTSGPAPIVSASNSTITLSTDFGTPADGLDQVEITITVRDEDGNPMRDQVVSLSISGSGNLLTQPAAATSAAGTASGTLASTIAETKTVTATVNPGADEVVLDSRPLTSFVQILPGQHFVRQSGSDTNDGTSPVNAWRTLAHAATQVSPGDTVYVGAGTYAESFTIDTGSHTAPITFRADRDGGFTGDAGSVVLDAAGADFGVHFDGATNITFRGFTVTNALPGNLDGAGIYVSNSSEDINLVENEIYGNDRGISIRDSQDVLAEGNRISNNFGTVGHGFVVAATDNVELTHNLIYNNSGFGVCIGAGVTGFDVALNTLYLNGRDQICETTAGSTTVISNCIITNGFDDGISVPAGSAVAENNNLVFGNSGLDKNDGGANTLHSSSTSADPLFDDPAGIDGILGGANGADDSFFLNLGSPALDAGDEVATNVSLRFGGALGGYSSRLDGTPDGVAPDGPALNLGYHFRPEVDPFSALESGQARIFFARRNETQLVSREYTPATDNLGANTRTAPTNSTVKWVLSRVSPAGGSEELVANLTDDGTDVSLFVRRWDGFKWTEDLDIDPRDVGIQSADTDQRGFDLEYENLSGDALLVSADGNNVNYRCLENGIWSDQAPVFSLPLAAGGTILWIEMVPRPNSDEISMICLDDQENLFATYWDGSAWESSGAPVVVGDTITTTRLSKAFDAAYETLSGDLILQWGHTALIEETLYAVRPADTNTWVQGGVHSADGFAQVIRLASDPTSDRIVGGLSEGTLGPDVVGFMWDGDAWDHIAELDVSTPTDQVDLQVGWIGESGRAYLQHKDNEADSLTWAVWIAAGWKRQTDISLPGAGRPVFIETHSLPGLDELMTVFVDEAGKLFGLTYDGADWSPLNNGNPLGTQLRTDAAIQPFSFALKP